MSLKIIAYLVEFGFWRESESVDGVGPDVRPLAKLLWRFRKRHVGCDGAIDHSLRINERANMFLVNWCCNERGKSTIFGRVTSVVKGSVVMRPITMAHPAPNPSQDQELSHLRVGWQSIRKPFQFPLTAQTVCFKPWCIHPSNPQLKMGKKEKKNGPTFLGHQRWRKINRHKTPKDEEGERIKKQTKKGSTY
jgi:hypothetical protein